MNEQSDNEKAPEITILSAEFVGDAAVVDGCLDVGGVKVSMKPAPHGLGVYVRRTICQ